VTDGPAPSGQDGAQRRALAVLTAGQILGGLGVGVSVSTGSLAALQITGSQTWSGLGTTFVTVGAAIAAIPLARLASRRGRRPSLATGMLIAAAGALVSFLAMVLPSFPVLLLGQAMLGVGQAVNLQSRFAATDLSTAASRGRDLSLVVWSTTIGAVAGPNLVEPGQALGSAFGLPALAGVFLFPLLTQLLAAGAYLLLLRPDPLLLARERAQQSARALAHSGRTAAGAEVQRPARAAVWRAAILTIALSHVAMVLLMTMTPVHFTGDGVSLAVIGLTLSLHVAGMYALSPLFGVLVDRLGPLPVIVLGQLLLAGAGLLAALAGGANLFGIGALVLLGLGWSAGTVAGSALLVSAAPPERRIALQGRSDLAMNVCGALAGAVAGPILSGFGYAGLGLVLVLPAAVVVAVALVWGRPGAARTASA